MSATLRLSYGVGTDITHIDVQVITSISISVNKKVVSTPIVTKGVDATFPLESGCGIRYNISFVRVNPTSPNDDAEDSNLWSNEKWYTSMTALMNRWQARTDGCIINFNADGANPHQCVIKNERGYIRTLERRYDAGNNVTITGDLDISIGTMYMNREPMGLASCYLPPVEYSYAILDPGDLASLPAFGGKVGDVLGITENRPIPDQMMTLPLRALVASMDPATATEEDMALVMPGLPSFWEMCRRLTAYSATGEATETAKEFKGWSIGESAHVDGTPGTVMTLPLECITTSPLTLRARWGDAV